MPDPQFLSQVVVFAAVVAILFFAGIVVLVLRCYRKPEQSWALVRNGVGGPKVTFSGILVVPVIHRVEQMDISVKRVEIHRMGKDGLICRDNLRADIKVAFFVRVNKTPEDVLKVAQSLGCERGSSSDALVELFDAKFSEALKTVGKQFDFVDLYNSRERFKRQMLEIIGTDLNGYVLDDAAIDYLEQTPLDLLNPDNILDSEGIKKITELTAAQLVLANRIQRDKEKTITQQNVEAKEAILELEKQLAEKEAKQKREVEVIQVRETAETEKIKQEERLRVEAAKIRTDEELSVAEQNKERQVVVARKNKERTEAVETERVEKDRALEANERERVVTLAGIEKERAVEEEKRKIQDAIRQRIAVERAVVEEEERIKDTKAIAEAERARKSALIDAEKIAEVDAVKEVKAAEASRKSAVVLSEQKVLESEAALAAAEKDALAMKTRAEGKRAELAAPGLSEAEVLQAKAAAMERQGSAEAVVLEKKAIAEARGIAEKAAALQAQGSAEAAVLEKKALAEAKGIAEKATSMKAFDAATRTHEEYRLQLEKEKAVELAQVEIQKDIARSQAEVLREGLKSARIEIIGGESMFFDRIAGSIVQGKSIDRALENSRVLRDVKETFLDGESDKFRTKLQKFVGQFGVDSEDVKNLSVSALLLKMLSQAPDKASKDALQGMLHSAEKAGISNLLANHLN